MKLIRYIVAVVGFFLVLFVVAVVVGLLMAIIFPRTGQPVFMVGVGLDWRNIPGTILGLLAGVHSFRVSIRGGNKKSEK